MIVNDAIVAQTIGAEEKEGVFGEFEGLHGGINPAVFVGSDRLGELVSVKSGPRYFGGTP